MILHLNGASPMKPNSSTTAGFIINHKNYFYWFTFDIAKKIMAKKINPNSAIAKPKAYTFFEDVYDVVRQIPKGRVTSYGAIANFLGTKLSARMVGWAMNAAHNVQPKIHAQRVVNKNGMLTGKMHFHTTTLMQELLEKDGVKVENDTVQDFKKIYWDPAIELEIS